jgi:dienelactone hydrolase
MKRFFLVVATLGPFILAGLSAFAQPPGQSWPVDGRYGKLKTLNDYFPFTPPLSMEAWQRRKRELREQVLVATGLWPMPEKTPLQAVVHGKIDRDEYTIEKVFFASCPGHYVSGNLYRPKGKTGKRPAVLFAHGHWENGRLHDAGEKAAKKQVEIGAEKTVESARFLLQAPAAMLARLGCVVFVYDMVGVGDSTKIPHAEGFADAEAELRLQSAMGLQTWNSVRALDFVLSLADVDSARVAMTGASGGGTQTFMLGAIDDRLATDFPAVMVSTGMQGGCVCENCSLLRVGTGNVELAGLFAPRPMAMSAANDWTVEIEAKGYPQLRALYRLYDAEERVAAKCWPQFGHNYNQLAREMMYTWFNRHLSLGHPEPIHEKPFVPVPPKELSVYDAEHPVPRDAVAAPALRKTLTAQTENQLAAYKPVDPAKLDAFRQVYGTALRVMVADRLPAPGAVRQIPRADFIARENYMVQRTALTRASSGEIVPVALARGLAFDGGVIVCVQAAPLSEDGSVKALIQAAVKKNMAVLVVSPFMCGEATAGKPPQVDARYAGYTFGYNRSVLAQRVGDILTALAHARDNLGAKKIHLVGMDQSGPWVVLARGLCGNVVERCAANLDGFAFETVSKTADANMLPGAVRYGGLGRLAALCAPGEMLLHHLPKSESGFRDWTTAAYNAEGASKRLELSAEKIGDERVVAWLVR